MAHSQHCPDCSRLRLEYLEALHAVMRRGAGNDDEALIQAEIDAKQTWRSHQAGCSFQQP